jgi:hypothetical protein
MKLKSIGKMFGVALLPALFVAWECVVGFFWLYAISSLSIFWLIVIKIAGVIMGFLGMSLLLPLDHLSLNKLDKVLSTIFVALAVALAGFYLYNCSWIPLFAEVSTFRVVLSVCIALILLALIAGAVFIIWCEPEPKRVRAAMEESEKKEE